MRRVRVLREMPRDKRPFRFKQIQELSGIREDNIHGMIRDNEPPRQSGPRAMLSRALETLEKECGSVEMRPRVRMTSAGPVLDYVAVNPAALPVLPEVNK